MGRILIRTMYGGASLGSWGSIRTLPFKVMVHGANSLKGTDVGFTGLEVVPRTLEKQDAHDFLCFLLGSSLSRIVVQIASRSLLRIQGQTTTGCVHS